MARLIELDHIQLWPIIDYRACLWLMATLFGNASASLIRVLAHHCLYLCPNSYPITVSLQPLYPSLFDLSSQVTSRLRTST